VTKVYDGDTIWVKSRLHPSAPEELFCIRFFDFDAWELRTKCEAEKKEALCAKKALEEKILNKHIRISTIPVKEKYGRVLARIYLDDCDIIQWMIDNGHGHKYDGKKKKAFSKE